jgi:hypothetical protein
MPSRELPIRVQNIHFEVFLYVLINLIPFYLSIVVLRKLNVEGTLLLKVVARIMWNIQLNFKSFPWRRRVVLGVQVFC